MEATTASVGWLAVLPPILAIVLAILTRQVLPALFAGITLGWWLLGDNNPLTALAASLDGIINVLADPGDARVLAFALAIGGLIGILENTGGVRGFVQWLEQRRWVRNGRSAQWLAWWTGTLIFIESNLTLLAAGAVSRPLFDRYRVSREKLAYLIDSTSAPVCLLIPLNAWGAFLLSLLGSTALDDPLSVLVSALPLTFYALFAVAIAAASIAWDWHPGPMEAAEARARTEHGMAPAKKPNAPLPSIVSASDAPLYPGPALMLAPLVTMVFAVPVGLWVTGNGNPMAGSGSKAVLWAVLSGLAVASVLAARQRQQKGSELVDIALSGAGRMLPIALILLLAIALGDVSRALGTGPWLAQIVGTQVSPEWLPLLVFLSAAATAFAIGSSWGTFAIMIPIAMPLALALSLPAPLLLGAVLSGAVFGDHASPVSDTTVVASMAAATDHIEHVRTQLPYALLAAAMSALLYLGAGLIAAP
jgi:Na+/H+ antiporter NhaC